MFGVFSGFIILFKLQIFDCQLIDTNIQPLNGTRTHDLLITNELLLPAELKRQLKFRRKKSISLRSIIAFENYFPVNT